MKQVWSCGGGTQSAAIAALICDGKLPAPDFALMVDTEREKSSTWRYVFGTLQPELAKAGVDLVIIPKSQYATVDLYSKKNHDLLIPAYTANGDGKLPTWCSNEWKSRVMDRWLREHGVGPHDSIQWLGFSIDELKRIRAGRYRYPLVYDFPMNRNDCRDFVAKRGWPEPSRGGSACWMCPQMHDSEWIEMRDNDPVDFKKACEFDVEIRIDDPNVFVHRSGRPLAEIASELGKTDQESLFGCASGACFV